MELGTGSDTAARPLKKQRSVAAANCRGRDNALQQPGDLVVCRGQNFGAKSALNSRYPDLLQQPDSSPISQDQLAAEVRGIYAGLVMIEAKCINIDAAQAADPKSHLGPEQWQALIALHRTLLYEHHDFLMATQHPSASSVLRDLAKKYAMPARMWKHGIHTFLEVLRHRRPESQDYMLAFIYLAYQMMALLFETVPSFTDTWIECLGDLARYRMAIEEEKEAHATWGGVAARWYTMASDRHPAIGRLYHHLGILERPSLRKFCFYAKSLTCVNAFPNARDSLSTLCGPIVQDDQTIPSSRQSAEARMVTFHALVYTVRDQSLIDEVGRDALGLSSQQPFKLRDLGPYLAVTNVAALFEPGSPTNMSWQLYTAAINLAMQGSGPSATVCSRCSDRRLKEALLHTDSDRKTDLSAHEFLIDCFNSILDQYNDAGSRKDCLSCVHVALAWLHSLHALRTRLQMTPGHKPDIPIDPERLSWGKLAELLNTLSNDDLEGARQGTFLGAERQDDGRPLSEDYTIRGLRWGQFHFSPGWFDGQCEDDGRPVTGRASAEKAISRRSALPFKRVLRYCKAAATCSLLSRPLVACAAPIDNQEPGFSSSADQASIWLENADKIGLPIITGVFVLATALNLMQIAARRPQSGPVVRAEIVIGTAFTTSVLAVMKNHELWRNAAAMIWIFCQTDYLARMSCRLKNGRLYFWSSVTVGLFISMFMAALQATTRPTLASVIADSLPLAPFFIACAACFLSKAVN